MSDLRARFIAGLQAHQKSFDIFLSEKNLNDLAFYYEVIQENNEILHLVAPCPPEEFAVRHILESLTLLERLPKNAKFADVGAGAGLPSLPCLIVREDLRGVLIESKLKKAKFLEDALNKFQLQSRVRVVNRQFEELAKPDVSYILCRALDKFTQKLPRLLKWSDNGALLFFGGSALREELQKHGVKFTEKLMPLSEQRFLFVSVRK